MSFLTDKIYKKLRARLTEDMNEFSYPDYFQPVLPDEKADLNVLLFADPQNAAYMPSRQRCFSVAAYDVQKSGGHFDAAVVCGDIAENGLDCEYRIAADVLNTIAGQIDKILLMPGNHDIRIRPYRRHVHNFGRFAALVKNAVPIPENHYRYSLEIKGYKFIVMGADLTSFEAAHISRKQIEWLDKEIASANGKPVFIFNHQSLKHTNGLPDSWGSADNHRGSVGRQSDKIEKVFRKYKNVFFICGHLHAAPCSFSYEDYGEFKAITVPTAGNDNHGLYDLSPQYMVMRVYPDRVEFRHRAPSLGKYWDERITGASATFFVE